MTNRNIISLPTPKRIIHYVGMTLPIFFVFLPYGVYNLKNKTGIKVYTLNTLFKRKDILQPLSSPSPSRM